jgi:hypothetical protein
MKLFQSIAVAVFLVGSMWAQEAPKKPSCLIVSNSQQKQDVLVYRDSYSVPLKYLKPSYSWKETGDIMQSGVKLVIYDSDHETLSSARDSCFLSLDEGKPSDSHR